MREIIKYNIKALSTIILIASFSGLFMLSLGLALGNTYEDEYEYKLVFHGSQSFFGGTTKYKLSTNPQHNSWVHFSSNDEKCSKEYIKLGANNNGEIINAEKVILDIPEGKECEIIAHVYHNKTAESKNIIEISVNDDQHIYYSVGYYHSSFRRSTSIHNLEGMYKFNIKKGKGLIKQRTMKKSDNLTLLVPNDDSLVEFFGDTH